MSVHPASRSACTRLAPTNPEAPVTSTLGVRQSVIRPLVLQSPAVTSLPAIPIELLDLLGDERDLVLTKRGSRGQRQPLLICILRVRERTGHVVARLSINRIVESTATDPVLGEVIRERLRVVHINVRAM